LLTVLCAALLAGYRSAIPVGADCFRKLIPYGVKLPLTICPRIKISGVIKISLIAKANLLQVIQYFDVYSQYNQLKIAILGVPLCIGKL